MPPSLRHELARKTIHLASALIPSAYALGIPRPTIFTALALAGLTATAVELARARSSRARAAFNAAVGPLLRPHEHARWSGATWMCAAYLLAVLLFPRPYAVAAMLAVAFGDAAAAVVGRLAGHVARRHVARPRVARPRAAPLGDGPASPGAKTWAGSLACLAATVLGALCIARLGVLPSLACGAAAMLAERPRWALDDNVRIVLASGAAAWATEWAVRAA